MLHLARCLLLCLGFVALPQLAVAEEDPWLMLEKAALAAHKLNYKGIFVYQCGQAVSSLQIIHTNYAQGEFVRLTSLDGAPREVLRQGNEVLIYSAQNEKVSIEKKRVQHSFPALLPGLTDSLKANYQIRVAGKERVGGRDGVILQLEPRDQYRYGYHFSVDREYGLLLKYVMLDEHANSVEQVAFSQLSLMEDTDMQWFRPNPVPGKAYVLEPQESVTPLEVDGRSWVIAKLPPGFRKVDQVKRNVPGKSAPVNHLIFSDGIASVSLFIEPLEKNVTPKVGQMTQGATHIFAQAHNGYQLIVVGEVPEITVKHIAEAVSFKK